MESDEDIISSQRSAHFDEDQICDENCEDLFKVFNDSVHGHISLHILLVKFIDTPQFQRLRNIRQLGANYYVYPGATHNRFEHSIGTSYLAGEVARHLHQKQPSLNITEEDILCVQLAGLCHDLGHGPFSHMFDLSFIPRVEPDTTWTHEEGSIKMLDHMIEHNDLMVEMEKYNLDEHDVIFIKELIYGQLPGHQNGVNADSGWKYLGREKDKSFLYEIVSNKRNSVDVDKWDYFARDCHHLGLKNSFDHRRFILHLKVLTVEGDFPQICARDKECQNLYEMFHTRSLLHKRAYKHKISFATESMICDALCLANNHIKLKGENNNLVRISDTVKDMTAFIKLTDSIFFQILYSDDDHEDMIKARNILERIHKRNLYQFVDSATSNNNIAGNLAKKKEMQQQICDFSMNQLHPSDIIIHVKKVNYGMKEKNPCEKFLFYDKMNPNKPYMIRREEVSTMLPASFQDVIIEIYCKNKENKEVARDCFIAWCKFMKLNHKGNIDSTLTPLKRSPQPGTLQPISVKKVKLHF